MKDAAILARAALLLPLVLAGCSRIPGKPTPGDEVPRPTAILNFATLYGENCAGCHGANGQHGAAIDLGNPEYQALVDDATLRNTIAQGLKGTLMPAFAQSAGGMLTDQQVDALVKGMRAHWARPAQFAGVVFPSYKADMTGDVARGEIVYNNNCSMCHDEANAPSVGTGPITNKNFLSLMNNQVLRTIVITGRPDFGMPDWRERIPGAPMSKQDIADVVAWLASQRPVTPSAETQPTPAQPTTQMQPAHAGSHGGAK
ncbi:MAG TPA: c-type cytochrome [Acidobacteriaceae bacterium]|jgi:cytochrome c oxidase cbb3-type subunit 3/ubiquinol-cytochrome c reductase cytochrome c subunit|nr:c-type cytochrome [Acidobacteriaceae bacterium]